MTSWRDPTAGPHGRSGADGRIRRALDSLAKAFRDKGVPAGTCYPFIGDTAPNNHVFMYGQTITNAASLYPDLWDNTPSTWKSGSNLVVPDLRGRIPVGLDNMGGSDAGRLAASNTLGGTGGAETHTLVTGEVPAHSHTPSDASSFLTDGGSLIVLAFGADFSPGVVDNTTSSGGGGAHNNMQPYILLNWILKLT